jgi:hypothetical protein
MRIEGVNSQGIEVASETNDERPPVLAVRHGRGRTGGSTFLDLLIQRARLAGRSLIIGDGDRGNATLAGLYPPGDALGAVQPRSDDSADVSDWITALSGEMVESRSSLVLDLGGGDRVLSEHSRAMALPDFCEAYGWRPLAIYMIGPDLEDFEHVFRIFKEGCFKTDRSILVMNESLVRAGKNASGAFDAIEKHRGYEEMTAVTRLIAMPRLECMGAVRAAGLSFYEAIENRKGANGKPLGLGLQFQVKTWINQIERNFMRAGVEEWLP